MERSTKGVPNDVTRRIGANLRSAREAAGLSPEEAAETIGVTPRTLARYEAGACEVPWARLGAAATAYGMDLAALLVLHDTVEPIEVEVVEPVPDRAAELAASYGHHARRLALAVAAGKIVSEASDEAREALREIAGAMRELGSAPKTSEVVVDGTKVGRLTMASGRDWAVVDDGAYGDWAIERGQAREHFTLDTRRLTPDQRDLLAVWAAANGVSLERHVVVDKALERDVRRIGDAVVTGDGEAVPGAIAIEPSLTPRMSVGDPRVVFAAIGSGHVIGIDESGDVAAATPVLEGEVA